MDKELCQYKTVGCNLCKRLILPRKQLETDGYILSIVAADTLVLKYQAISIHNAD